MSTKTCATHHHACDCREAIFAEMLEALRAITTSGVLLTRVLRIQANAAIAKALGEQA